MAEELTPYNSIDERQPRVRNAAQQIRKMQALAMELSEKRLREGTASSAEITFWLSTTSEKEQLQIENLRYQGELLKAKTEAIQSERKSNEAYTKAMEAFAGYLPTQSEEVIDGEFYER